MAQSVKHPILDISSGLNLRVQTPYWPSVKPTWRKKKKKKSSMLNLASSLWPKTERMALERWACNSAGKPWAFHRPQTPTGGL